MQLIKLTKALFLIGILSGCATYVKSGSDESEVRLFKNSLMTSYDTFLRAAEHCLEHKKLAVLSQEAYPYGHPKFDSTSLSTPTQIYRCVEL